MSQDTAVTYMYVTPDMFAILLVEKFLANDPYQYSDRHPCRCNNIYGSAKTKLQVIYYMHMYEYTALYQTTICTDQTGNQSG